MKQDPWGPGRRLLALQAGQRALWTQTSSFHFLGMYCTVAAKPGWLSLLLVVFVESFCSGRGGGVVGA